MGRAHLRLGKARDYVLISSFYQTTVYQTVWVAYLSEIEVIIVSPIDWPKNGDMRVVSSAPADLSVIWRIVIITFI